MLVDQYLTNGVVVTFLAARPGSSDVARLLRQIEYPIHGVRIMRLAAFVPQCQEVKPVHAPAA